MIFTNINHWAQPDQRQHVLDESCWCQPAVTVFSPNLKNASRTPHTVPSFAPSYQPVTNTTSARFPRD